MGCPGGTRSVFTRAFGAKRELHCIFLGKKTIIISSKHDPTIFFPITIFFYENVKKRMNTGNAKKCLLSVWLYYRSDDVAI